MAGTQTAGGRKAKKTIKRKRKEEGGRPSDPLEPIDGIELVFGLVGPTGTDLDVLSQKLAEQLGALNYDCHVISLSKLIVGYSPHSIPRDEYRRIRFLMREGTELCKRAGNGDFVARLGIAAIQAARTKKSGSANVAARHSAYIIRSFKRREEVELYRKIYGKAFNLISAYSSAQHRLDSLSRKLAKSSSKPRSSMQPKALELINIDYAEEGQDFGQSVRDTFPQADYFVNVDDAVALDVQLNRLVKLVFGNPYLTPSRDEYAMFFAQAASLRSGDLSRQVGAVIVSRDGELLATGCNEVPKTGGGLYWAEDPSPHRDLELGFDMNARIKAEIVQDLLHKLRNAGWLKDSFGKQDDDVLYKLAVLDREGVLKDAQCLDVIEFGRAVHAEMAAVSDAARRGISLAGARLFCTTFPCHICARHIVASGISEVVYVEPYPKSRTADLFSDSIAVNPQDATAKVAFRPFSGVAPRRYFDFFELVGKRKDGIGQIVPWPGGKKLPKVERFVLSYLMMEATVLAKSQISTGA